MKSVELLEHVLDGGPIDDSLIERLLREKPAEDLYMDWKAGRKLRNKKEAKRLLRRQVAGFANGAGGVLLVGLVHEDAARGPEGLPAFTIDPCPPDIKKSWFHSVLQGLAKHLATPIRVERADTKKGPVWVIGVPRAPHLIPIQVGQELIYYARVEDSTPALPPYMVADLLLGRRATPSLTARIPASVLIGPSTQDRLVFAVENEGYSWADEVVVGIVYPTVEEAHLPPAVRRAVVLSQHGTHRRRAVGTLGPFQDATPSLLFGGIPTDHTLQAAVYVMARNTLPIWYQLVGHCRRDGSSYRLYWDRLQPSDRPVVAFTEIAAAAPATP